LRNTENKRNHIGITKVEILLALNGGFVPITGMDWYTQYDCFGAIAASDLISDQ
jgi:hypothetical protein